MALFEKGVELTRKCSELLNEAKQKIATLIHCIDDEIHIHDFRMVTGPTHTNVIFDVVVPYDFKKNDDEIRKNIETIVKSIDGNYFSVVNVDRSYV